MTVYIVIAHYNYSITPCYHKDDKTKLIGVYNDKKKASKVMLKEIYKVFQELSNAKIGWLEHNDYVEGHEGTYCLWLTDKNESFANEFTISLIKKRLII